MMKLSYLVRFCKDRIHFQVSCRQKTRFISSIAKISFSTSPQLKYPCQDFYKHNTPIRSPLQRNPFLCIFMAYPMSMDIFMTSIDSRFFSRLPRKKTILKIFYRLRKFFRSPINGNPLSDVVKTEYILQCNNTFSILQTNEKPIYGLLQTKDFFGRYRSYDTAKMCLIDIKDQMEYWSKLCKT